MSAPGSPVSASVGDCDVAGTAPENATWGRVRALHARLADALQGASEACRELSEIRLDVPPKPRLMDPVHARGTTGELRAQWLTVRDVAERLQVDERTVRRWREEGKLPPAFANGSVVRWRSEDIDAWTEEQTR